LKEENQLEQPSVIHPKLVKIKGFRFQVVAYCGMTDEQALKFAIHFYRSHAPNEFDRNKVLKVVTTYGQDSLSRL